MNDTKVIVQVSCGNATCKYVEKMPASVSARIGDGGCIELDFTPEFPDNWYKPKHGYYDTVCPVCADEHRAYDKHVEDQREFAKGRSSVLEHNSKVNASLRKGRARIE
jgi:hypothetical protein